MKRNAQTIEDFKIRVSAAPTVRSVPLELLTDELIPYSYQVLSERDLLIIKHRFQLDGSEFLYLKDIAKILNLSTERVRHLEYHAIRKVARFFLKYQSNKQS